MAKLINDKYYTPPDIAKKCIDMTYKIIGKDNIVEVIEPSAGNGSFSLQIDNCIAYDIEPEHESIIKQDFLTLDIPYKKGRLIIGNPPYGSRMNLAQKFFKKSTEIADYIAFILPISQLNNTNSLYQFDLIHSEDLGKQWYTDRELHCCFNIYKRPKNGLNKKKVKKLKDVEIVRQDSKRYESIHNYDLRICRRGQAVGKVLSDGERYAGEYKIIVKNDEIREDVIKVLSTVNWHEELNFISTPYLLNTNIIDLLKREIKGIK